jgi:hypothetical protein
VGGGGNKQCTESTNSPRSKKFETGKEESKDHTRHFILNQGTSQIIRLGRPNNQFRILLRRFTRVRENVRRLRRELWRQKNWLLHHDNSSFHTSFFNSEFFYHKEYGCLPQPPYFSLFPLLKLRPFDTTEVFEAESQATLNTLTEHDFQDAFNAGNGAYGRGGTTSSVMVVIRPKVSF